MKKIILMFCLIYSVLLIHSSQLSAQTNVLMPSVGIYGGVNLNFHNFDINYLETIKSKSTKTGANFGINASYPLSNNFVLSLRAGYNSTYGELDRGEWILTDNMGNEVARIDDRYEFSLSYWEISPIIEFHNTLPIGDLYFLAGLEIGLPNEKNAKSYVHDNSQENNTQERNYDIQELNVRLCPIIGAGYLFNISDKFSVAPELSFRYPINKVTDSKFLDSWTISQLRMAVNVNYIL